MTQNPSIHTHSRLFTFMINGLITVTIDTFHENTVKCAFLLRFRGEFSVRACLGWPTGFLRIYSICIINGRAFGVVRLILRLCLNRKFHTSQISHRVKNWYQNVTFGNCEIGVWSISIILGVLNLCSNFTFLYF